MDSFRCSVRYVEEHGYRLALLIELVPRLSNPQVGCRSSLLGSSHGARMSGSDGQGARP
jgi:hypothetical protein